MAYIYLPRSSPKPKKYKTRTDENTKSRQSIYQSKTWKLLRHSKIIHDPCCEVCAMRGIIKIADEVHHLRSFMTAEDQEERLLLAYDYDNLISVCRQCHNRIHNIDLKGCDTREKIKNRLEKLEKFYKNNQDNNNELS